jgi:hypothetical protein
MAQAQSRGGDVMGVGLEWYKRAVLEGRLRDTEENREAYLRKWEEVGKVLGKKKDPGPPPSTPEFDPDPELAWLYE